MALDDIKQYQSKGGVLSAMDAGLLVTSEGKPLLPHAVRREPPQSEAKKSPPPPPLETDAEWNQKVADFKEQTRELVAGAAAEAKVDGEEVDAATQAEKKRRRRSEQRRRWRPRRRRSLLEEEEERLLHQSRWWWSGPNGSRPCAIERTATRG